MSLKITDSSGKTVFVLEDDETEPVDNKPKKKKKVKKTPESENK
jgi:hypothetical protein